MKNILLAGLLASAVVGVSAPAAAATTFDWTQGDSGDIWSQDIDATYADTIQFFGTSESYGEGIAGPFAHSHGQAVTWSIYATVDGVQQTLFTQTLGDDNHQSIVDLGVLSFAAGTVSNIGFGCENCSGNTFHQFDGASFTLDTSAVPEPASWAMMVGGFGLLGGALRRKKAAVSFA